MEVAIDAQAIVLHAKILPHSVLNAKEVLLPLTEHVFNHAQLTHIWTMETVSLVSLVATDVQVFQATALPVLVDFSYQEVSVLHLVEMLLIMTLLLANAEAAHQIVDLALLLISARHAWTLWVTQ
jgi:hypothetical protein